ncbi:MAG: DNA mismatch repair endonuclease MutL [Chloroflexi bacterium]|nr:DNA mismatch repair endonuclease MutL [Chloroflexota bacterium]
MPIKVLTRDLAAKIAAGEVVERPASVVKELVENSIDAGASQITVEINSGGVEQIKVVDDGHGIPAEEVAIAFERHATSKIDSQEQLYAIATLGFRGEALPSIAAVSRTILTSRQPLNTGGFRIELHWGEPVSSGSQGGSPGTTVEVSDLFGNLPARRKFLRSSSAETSRIQELVSRYALVFPGIRFQLAVDGRVSFTSPGNGHPREALLAVYGPQAATAMLEVHGEDQESGYQVDGFTGAPSLTRANRTYMTFFINRRWVQSRMLSFAVEEAYMGLLQVKRYPLSSLNISIPYEHVDVNAHPSKREVRFQDESRVFSTVQRAVRAVLVADSPVPSLSPPPGSDYPAAVASSFFPRSAFGGVRNGGGRDSVEMLERTGGSLSGPVGLDPGMPASRQPAPPLKVVGQLKLTYIVAEGSEGMFLVDQHAAHERVLFDRICQKMSEQEPQAQTLLEPVPVELSPAQGDTLRVNREALENYGFQFEPFGDGSYLLRAVPAIFGDSGPAKSLLDVLDTTAFEGLVRRKEDVVAASISCHGAIRAGKQLTEPEMAALLEQLEATPNPHTCPHGRPTMVHFSSNHMEREFGRR